MKSSINFAILAASLAAKQIEGAMLQQPMTFNSNANNVCEVVLNFDAHRFQSEMLQFNTRAYNGQTPGPTIRLKRGDTLKLMLQNHLGPETEGSIDGDVEFFKDNDVGPNRFQLCNTTNVHFHGLHVQPHGNSDNIEIRVDPGMSVEYEVKIPLDHPTGTFYYHPHFHGSVSIQLGGGAEGALIIEDDPTKVPVELANMKEHILLLQHFLFEIQYYDGSDFGSKLMRHLNNNMKHIVERSRSNIELDIQTNPDVLQGGSELNSFHVNGQWLPTINMQPGETSRFRVINGAAAESVSLVIEGEYPFKYSEEDLEAEQTDRLNGLHCDMTILAMDGVYLKEPWTVPSVHLPPGARADLAIHCPKTSGTGRLIFGSAITYDTQTHVGPTAHIHNGPIAYIDVSGIPLAVDMPLPKTLPERGYIEQLEAMMDTAPTGDDWEVKWSRDKVGGTRQWAINGQPYEHGEYKTTLDLGSVSTWTMYSDDYHPAHLHTHHFQIAEVPTDSDKGQQLFSMYPGMWRDTIPTHKYEMTVVNVLPVDYAGEQMFHCHVGSHADQGMAAQFYVNDNDNKAISTTAAPVYAPANYGFTYAAPTPPQARNGGQPNGQSIVENKSPSNDAANNKVFGFTTLVVAVVAACLF